MRTHPINASDQSDALVFFDDAQRALHLSKGLSQSGYIAGPFLASVTHEMERARDGLMSGGKDEMKPYERMLHHYLEAAI